ncbi:hypothetical protein NMG60_11030464 [Bertholletia excelsa]
MYTSAAHQGCEEKPKSIISASSKGYAYSDVANHFQGFEPNPDQLYNLTTTGMDVLVDESSSMRSDGFSEIKRSKYLGPAEELLREFCYLGTQQMGQKEKLKKAQKASHDRNESSLFKKHSLDSLEMLELQGRYTKLFSMLEEVDGRYRNYCDQMKALVSAFEMVASSRAAAVYLALASKAMSRHFRCLRDEIVGQIKVTKKAMGERDAVAPGTRGETPRLKLVDQALRQQKAFRQMSLMESHPWRPQRGLPERSVSVLRAWLFEHFLHPYPSDVDKLILARQTGLSRSQVSNWFINARVRLWKPMVEDMYIEETKEQDNMASAENTGRPTVDPRNQPDEQNPISGHLVRVDSECLSSVINNPAKSDTIHVKMPPNQQPYIDFRPHHNGASGGRELDILPHNHHEGGSGLRRSVSLTLGLQGHGGNGVSLAFSPATQNSLFYSRDQIENFPMVDQYSLLGNEGQNLPYRKLMEAQLLHDLTG